MRGWVVAEGDGRGRGVEGSGEDDGGKETGRGEKVVGEDARARGRQRERMRE